MISYLTVYKLNSVCYDDYLIFFSYCLGHENSSSIVNENKTHKSKRTDMITSPDLEMPK